MSDIRERIAQRRPEVRSLHVPEVEVVITVGETPVRQAIGIGDDFTVESNAGQSTWQVAGFETTQPDRPSTRRQSVTGLDVRAMGLSGVREDARGAVERVRGLVEIFPVSSVAHAINKAQTPR